MSDFLDESTEDFISEDSKIKQITEYMASLSEEAWKGWLEMMKSRRSAENKMKEVEKQLEEDAEKELGQLIEETEKVAEKKKK